MSATESINWPEEWPVWWDTGDGRPDGQHMARIIEVFPYTGKYPQWFSYVLRLADPNTRKGWTEMAIPSTEAPHARQH